MQKWSCVVCRLQGTVTSQSGLSGVPVSWRVWKDVALRRWDVRHAHRLWSYKCWRTRTAALTKPSRRGHVQVQAVRYMIYDPGPQMMCDLDNIWKYDIWGCKEIYILRNIVQMKFLAMHITNQKLSFDIFMVRNVLNIFMEHDLNILMIFGIKENLLFWPIQCIFGYCYKYTPAT